MGEGNFRPGWKLVIVGVIILLCLWIASSIYTTLIIFGLAWLFAYSLNPLIRWAEARKVRRGFATVTVFLFLTLFIFSWIFLLIPVVMAQVNTLVSAIPEGLGRGEAALVAWQTRLDKLKISPQIKEGLKSAGEQVLEKGGEMLTVLVQQLGTALLRVLSGIFIVVTAIVVSLYILLDYQKIKDQFYELLPEPLRDEAVDLLSEMGQVIGGFLRGQILLCLIMGAASFAGFWILALAGVPFHYGVVVSFLNAIAYAIPYIGSLTVTAIAIVLAYLQSGSLLLPFLVFLSLFIMGRIVDNFCVPAIMGKEIGVSPLFIIFAVFAGGELFGFWGFLLGIPLAAAARVVFLTLKRKMAPAALKEDSE